MSDPIDVLDKGLERFLEDVLKPAVHTRVAPVQVEVFQCEEPVALDVAEHAAFRPVALGWEWGPVWSTAWFRVHGRVTEEQAGREVSLRLSSGTEALVWLDGVARSGLDVNRDTVTLFEAGSDGRSFTVLVEAACNHPFGISTFEWDDEEVHRRWRREHPGRLERAETCVVDREAEQLAWAFEFTLLLARELEAAAPRRRDLYAVLQRARDAVTGGDPATALTVLRGALGSPAASMATDALAVGHAHIDTAWLWPLRETRRKCMRSFSNVLGLMERYPELHFICSQALQYRWIEESNPELFGRIRARVEEGRWEPIGGMWVEPDCNVPSGEALIRQVLHGAAYWREKFGDRGEQDVLYLPDTFGFPASLPQVMRHTGLSIFVTNKLHWNVTNRFPHTTFRWRGIDGSEVLGHLTPGGNYNATNTPAELRKGVANLRGAADFWLQPFGFGDGGGGPTAQQVEFGRLANDCDGLPRVRYGSMREFCRELEAGQVKLREQGADYPLWCGELYLEIHRGTLTTQGPIKQRNRSAERGLRFTELLAFAGPEPLASPRLHELRGELDSAWTTLLQNQFHDILPGSSIGWVHREALAELAAVNETCEMITAEQAARWRESLDGSGCAAPFAVFNPTSHPRSGRVEVDGLSFFAEDVPALGVKVVDARERRTSRELRVDERTLQNTQLTVRLDDAGRIASLVQRATGREACRSGPLNQLALYEDRPHMWDAWDIDPGYEQSERRLTGPAERFRVVESGPLRVAVEVERPLGERSRLIQTYRIEADSPRLDVHSFVDWHEDHTLLRALHDVDVRSDSATYAIQFGTLERPTHRNTSWDEARFEVCAHGWMDLSEPGFGVALLNDGKYGHSCLGSVMGMSLLRSPKHPDPDSDMGEHEFTYSLMPHAGDWRAAGVDREADRLDMPLRAWPIENPAGRLREWSPFGLATEGVGDVRVTAVKLSESRDDELVVRLHESRGARTRVRIDWRLAIASLRAVDGLERDLEQPPDLRHESATTTLELAPYQIVTLAVGLGDA